MATWDVTDLSRAMECAVRAHAMAKLMREKDHKLQFNGFWRNGDNQNVCLWLDKATWHDAKTGEGGGCKEFAKIAFNLSLSEFMARYGHTPSTVPIAKPVEAKKNIPKLTKPINQIWLQLCQHSSGPNDNASIWLEDKRGFKNPRSHIGSGFTALKESDADLFEQQHRNFIFHRANSSPQIIVPLRSTKSDEVRNLFFRSIANVSKEEKTRLLPNAGGWTELDGSPRAFGFPYLINDFSNLLICEGMADYFAAECLLDCNEKILPIGASNADGISKWAQYLAHTKYTGQVFILHQLDKDENGELSIKKIGPSKAINALKCLKENSIKAHIFDWPFFLKNTTSHPSQIKDIADAISISAYFQECSFEHLQDIFLITLTNNKDA